MLQQLIQEYQNPTQQVTSGNQPLMSNQAPLQKLASQPSELDSIIKDLQYRYIHDSSPTYLGFLYLLVDYYGVGLVVRESFKTFAKNINQIPFNEKTAGLGVLLSQLVFTKLSPLDQDFNHPDLQEMFEISCRAQVVDESPPHKLKMVQQVADAFYITQEILLAELETRIYKHDSTSDLDQINYFLKTLYQKSNTRQFQIQKKNDDQDDDDYLVYLYGILVEDQQEFRTFRHKVTLNCLLAELFVYQEDRIENMISYIKTQQSQVNSMLSLQRMESKMDQPPKVEHLFQDQQLYKRAHLILLEEIAKDETVVQYFKNVTWPLKKSIQNLIKQQICSLANGAGGFIYLGIKDQNRQVVGIQLTKQDREDLRVWFENLKVFHPSNPQVEFSVLPLKNQQNQTIVGSFVIRVYVHQGLVDRLYSIDQIAFIDMKPIQGAEFLELTYQFCKNPREVVQPLSCQEPEPLIDITTRIKQIEALPPQERTNKFVQQGTQRRDMSIEYIDQSQIVQKPPENNNQRTFKISLYYELQQEQMQIVIKEVLKDLINTPNLNVTIDNQNEISLTFPNQKQVDQLQARIMKQIQQFKNLQVIRTIKLGQRTLFELPPQLFERVQKQTQAELLVFGFIKMDYTQKSNLHNQLIRLLQELKITTQFVHPFENSILIGFNGQHQLDHFVYAINSQSLVFRRFGYQSNLMGGKVSKKITYKGISNEIIDTVKEHFQIEVGTNQDGSGFLLCKDEEDAAKIFDYMLIQKNRLKKNAGPNKLEVLWQLETLLVNIK